MSVQDDNVVPNDPDQVEDDDNIDNSTLADTGTKKRLFQKELRCMMYGFGDADKPYSETVEMLEDLVIEYITRITQRAVEIGRPGRIGVEDIIFIVRKDAKKFSRVKDLLIMNEELKKARKAFDEHKYSTNA